MDFDDSSSLSSALSSAPPSDDERLKLAPIFLKAMGKAKKAAPKPKKAKEIVPPASPPRPPRSPSPPHEETLADNSDIALLVMFRSRFSAAFPPKLAHFGPQDIERGIEGPVILPQVEGLLCALLGLVLNRKKPVEPGHYGRALEEALASQKAQWPRSWGGQNPLPGTRTVNAMPPAERLNLLRTLVMWSLSSSEIISQMIKESYKQSRHDDDLNQPLSVQPWGLDGDKRRYWLIEGQDDTSFRLYRENAKFQKESIWWSIGGSIEEMQGVAEFLEKKDTTQAARRLSSKIGAAIPRFEATEEKRRRREYRQMRRAQFARPEPGFSLYEGRTRGKRLRYTFDDDEDDFDDSDMSVRRSGRHSDRSTPAAGPVVTASGRQVRTREGGLYGESLLSGQATNADTPTSLDFDEPEILGRGSRQAARNALGESRKRRFNEIYNDDQLSDEDDAQSSAGWNSADNEDEGDDNKFDDDEDEADISDLESEDEEPSSLIVKLKIPSLDRSLDETSLLSNGKDAEETKPAAEAEAEAEARPQPEAESSTIDEPSTLSNGITVAQPEPAPRVETSREIGQDGFVLNESKPTSLAESPQYGTDLDEAKPGAQAEPLSNGSHYAYELGNGYMGSEHAEHVKEVIKDDSGFAVGDVDGPESPQKTAPEEISRPEMQIHHPLVPVDTL